MAEQLSDKELQYLAKALEDPDFKKTLKQKMNRKKS